MCPIPSIVERHLALRKWRILDQLLLYILLLYILTVSNLGIVLGTIRVPSWAVCPRYSEGNADVSFRIISLLRGASCRS